MKITTPITCRTNEEDCDELIKQLRQLQATEVFIVLPGMHYKNKDSDFSILKDMAEKLRDEGIEISVWLNGLTYSRRETHQGMVGLDGQTHSPLACPLHDQYVDEYCELLAKIANIGIKSFAIDDDFRMQICNVKMTCFCDKHMEFYSNFLGETVTREKMKEMLINKAPNKYREAWIAGCRAALEHMAKKIRKTLDDIDPAINVTPCIGPALFGADGTDPYSIVEILAGKNEKRVRLIGAPYWEIMFDYPMLSAVDFSRHQAFECRKREIKTFAEGDAWPRPRFACSAAKLEFFHTIVLGDGNYDYILKYGTEYTSKPFYEQGYAKIAENNKGIYNGIEEMFSNKTCVGFHFVESLDKGNVFHGLTETPELDVITSKVRTFPHYLSLPICFDGDGVNLIFGENARIVERDMLKNGSILDIKSAMILNEMGIDVGILKFEHSNNKVDEPTGLQHLTDSCREYYVSEDDICELGAQPHCEFGLRARESAKILSKITVNGRETIGSYFYTTKEVKAFLYIILIWLEM